MRNKKEPTLEGRLKHPLKTREAAIKQLIKFGMPISKSAQKVLDREKKLKNEK